MAEITKAEMVEKEWAGEKGSIEWAKTQARGLRLKGRSADAHMVQVSPYYSAIKRNLLRAPWRLLQATLHAVTTLEIDMKQGRTLESRHVEELNVLAAPLSLWPRWFPGLLSTAHGLIKAALNENHPDNISGVVKPHDTGLNLVLLGRIERKLGKKLDDIREFYDWAYRLRQPILAETEQKIAKRQWCRIAQDVGFFYLDLCEETEKYAPEALYHKGCWLVQEALQLAREKDEDGEKLSRDQEKKILSELEVRDLLDEFQIPSQV